jgi:hypothetical protein
VRAIDELNPDGVPRKVLFVAGAGRSGTSTLSGILSLLGMHVPKPEVVADSSNPKGFGEPQWAVELHDRLLKEAGVQVSDSRPSAWFETGRISTREPARIRVAEWLDGHFGEHPELVVKDPRLSWFLGLWRVAAIRTGATPVFATMLRPPAEVVGSKQKYYANKLGSAHLTASWLNMLLHTERATRDSIVTSAEGSTSGGATVGGRAFVRYSDLLDDWVKTTMSLGQRLDVQSVIHTRSDQIREVHRFIDPSLRRVTLSLSDLALPPRLHELTAETWDALNQLADEGGDTPEVHSTLDQLRDAYVELYEEAEAISKSSVVAARVAQARTSAEADKPSLAERVPHEVRAKIPASVRRSVRRVIGRERG